MYRGEALRQNPDEFTFDGDAITVARNIEGATLVYVTENGQEKRAKVMNAVGYSAEDIKRRDVFGGAMEQPIGTISGVPWSLRGRDIISPNITVAGGGLVTFTTIQVPSTKGSRLVDGPLPISRELGLRAGDVKQMQVVDPIQKELRII